MTAFQNGLGLGLGLALAGATAALGGDARTPVYASTTISAPGAYYLTRDVTGGGTLITITADGVDLDLNGYALIGDGSGTGISVSGGAGVRLRDGVIRSTATGVNLSRAAAVTVERIRVDSPGSVGIAVSYSEAVSIVDCLVQNPTLVGISLSGAGPYLLAFNDVIGAADDGLRFDGQGSIVLGTRVTGAGGDAGLTTSGANGTIFAGNQVLGGFADGMNFFSTEGACISGNVVQDVDEDAINVYSSSFDTRVAGNVVTGASLNGLTLYTDRTTVDGNLVTRSGDGLAVFGNDTVIRRNVARGNTDDYYVSSLSTGNVSSGDNFVPTRQ
jgi:hypothetical protein